MNPLDNLADIAEPGSVNIWPLAWGWWAVISIVLLLVVLLFVIIAKNVKRNAVRKTALAQLKHANATNTLSVSQASTLLKRTCISYCGREPIAKLHGSQWVEFLFNSLKTSSQKKITTEQLTLFAQSHYMPNPESNSALIFELTSTWLKAVDVNKLIAYKNEVSHV